MELYKQKLNEYTKSNGKPLTEKSKDHYYRQINLLVSKYGLDWGIAPLKEYLESNNFETPTKLSYINSILNYFSVMGYSNNQTLHHKKYKEELEKEKEAQPIVNPKKAENLVDWSEIHKWREALSTANHLSHYNNFSQVMTEVILTMYISYPRRNEIADLVFYPSWNIDGIEEKENKIVEEQSGNFTLCFCDYKTDGTYGTQEYVIKQDTELHKLIRNYLKKFNEMCDLNMTTLFVSCRDKSQPLSRLNLTKLLQRSSKKYIGKSISTDRIRKAYAGKSKEAIAQVENSASMLSHSVGVNMKHYNVKK